MTTEELRSVTKFVFKFRSLELARSFAGKCEKLHMIVMGDADDDGGWYWVAPPAITEKLNRAGYEYIK